jgi:hypothetical protein
MGQEGPQQEIPLTEDTRKTQHRSAGVLTNVIPDIYLASLTRVIYLEPLEENWIEYSKIQTSRIVGCGNSFCVSTEMDNVPSRF